MLLQCHMEHKKYCSGILTFLTSYKADSIVVCMMTKLKIIENETRQIYQLNPIETIYDYKPIYLNSLGHNSQAAGCGPEIKPPPGQLTSRRSQRPPHHLFAATLPPENRHLTTAIPPNWLQNHGVSKFFDGK